MCVVGPETLWDDEVGNSWVGMSVEKFRELLELAWASESMQEMRHKESMVIALRKGGYGGEGKF